MAQYLPSSKSSVLNRNQRRRTIGNTLENPLPPVPGTQSDDQGRKDGFLCENPYASIPWSILLLLSRTTQ